MKQYSIKGQTVFISGASSGIGKACARHFASLGANLIIAARRLDRLEELASELASLYGVEITAFQLDVRKNDEVEAVFQKIETVDILINNAGLALSSDKVQDARIENWETMIDTNVKGLLYVTKAALPSMIQRNRGHIINIGSVAGHECYAGGNVYSATKHAVKALTQSLRLDLLGTAIRVTQIDPGAVETEFSIVRWNDETRAKKFYEDFDPLTAEDIADVIVFSATRPPHVNVSELIVYPQAQASVSNIFKKQ